jgi:hypothetical protein
MEVNDGKVRKSCVKERTIRDASEEGRHSQERIGTKSEEPQAGDRDCPQRDTQEGWQGSLAQVITEDQSQPFHQEAINESPAFGRDKTGPGDQVARRVLKSS